MRTKKIYLTNPNKSEVSLKEAGRILREGGLVVFPTETVYGLGANATDSEAVGKIFEAKGRPSDNPLIVHIAEMEELNGLVKEMSEAAMRLAEAFWPGPMTMVLPKAPEVCPEVTAGLETVGVRMPSEAAARSLIKLSGVPIAAPSANISGKPSPTRAEHALTDMDGKVDVIIVGAPTTFGVESTVIDMTKTPPVILRPGAVTQEMIEEVIGPVALSKGISTGVFPEHPASPGMKYRHYSPKAKTLLVAGDKETVKGKILGYMGEHPEESVGVLINANPRETYEALGATVLELGRDPGEYARNLFATLREFDRLGVDTILAEAFEVTDESLAVADRLLHACGYARL